MSDERYRVTRSVGGGYTVRKTDLSEEIATGVLGAAGWVAGSIISASVGGIATLARNSRDRRIAEGIEAMAQAAEAEQFIRLHDLATAFSQRYKDNPAGPAFLGVGLAGQKRYEDAINAINQAERLGLHPLEAVTLRASTYREKRDTGQMLREYTILTQHEETRQEGFLGRAQGLIDIRDYNQALNDVNQAIAISPDETSYFVRAEVYRAKGELELAVEDYSRAIQLAPKISELRARRAEVYEQLGQTDLAGAERAAIQAHASTPRQIPRAQLTSDQDVDTESPLFAIIMGVAAFAVVVMLAVLIAQSGVSFLAIIPLALGVAAGYIVWRGNRANAIALATVIAGAGIMLFVR